MWTEDRILTWTLMLLFLADVFCNTWQVDYQRQHICAVKGSSVVVPCSYSLPDNFSVNAVRWGRVKPFESRGRFIAGSNLKKVTSRFRYIGGNQHNCSLQIYNVSHDDTGKYSVRFVMRNRQIMGSHQPGLTLKVVDLKVMISGSGPTKEGDSVNLTCINDCDLSSDFTWRQNKEPIYEGPVLSLSNVSDAHSGNYTCSLKTYPGATSAVTNIDVEYGPKNTSVAVKPSTEVETGSNVTLMCSSHSKPPVENYTWFEIDENGHTKVVGLHSVLTSVGGGQYLCCATNQHGSQNSSVVTVRVRDYWRTFTRDTLCFFVVAAFLMLTVLVVVGRLRRNRKWTAEVDCGEDMQNPDYVNWLVCDSNQSQHGQDHEGGVAELVYATIHFSTRELNMVQQRDLREDEVVIYSTVYYRNQPTYIEPS